jgi:hypothetical protein
MLRNYGYEKDIRRPFPLGKEDYLRSLAAKRLQRSVLRRPRNLKVCNAETTQHTRELQHRANLSRGFWEAVVGVGI